MNERSPLRRPRAWTNVASLGATRIALCAAAALAPLAAIGQSCTSSSDDAVADDASIETTQPAMPQPEAGGGAHQEAAAPAIDTGHPTTTGGDGGAPTADTGTMAKDAGNKDAAATSDACAAYCACYEKKCSVFVAIPTGQDCPDFCSTFQNNKTQYDCRFNMCFYNSNGPAENNNNHCQHTVGIDECL